MQVERLGSDHRLAAFTCGVKSLDDWLRSHALENDRRNLSRTFVLVDDANSVIGYYALTMGGVTRCDLPTAYSRYLPSYDIGMVLIARLAIAVTRQGEGFGRDLLVDAILHASIAGAHAAARFIAVDPIDESARLFYRRFGFRDISGDSHRRMYLRLDHAITALGDASHLA